MKFVFLICSLEALLPNKEYKMLNMTEEMTIIKKLELLVFSNIKFKNNQNVKKIIKKFNTYRCDIIHSNKNYIPTTEYALLREITEDICLFYIQHSSTHENVESVFNSLPIKPLAS